MNDKDTEKKAVKPPYLSFTSFKNFIKSLNKGVIPSRIDKSLMPGQSGTIQTYLMAALRYFELIDDIGVPAGKLEALVEAGDENFASVWRPVFEKAYAPVINSLELNRATSAQLQEKLGEQDLGGDTLRKAQSFFVAAAEAAGVTLAPQLKAKARTPRKKRASKTKQEIPVKHEMPVVSESMAAAATLLLDPKGERRVVLQAPPTVTQAELTRIQQWLSFQLIVDEGLTSPEEIGEPPPNRKTGPPIVPEEDIPF